MSAVEKIVNNIFGADGSDEVVCIDRFLGDEAIGVICERLRNAQYSGKKRLICRGNCIAQAGASAIADLLRNTITLQFVSIEWNQIGSVGAKAFADSLPQNRCLTYLDLRNNGIDNDGGIALALALMSNVTLKTLDIRWNKVCGDISFF
jgi:hypothetical protein